MATKPKLTKKRQTNWKAELTLQTASHSARPQDVPSVVQKDAGNLQRNHMKNYEKTRGFKNVQI